MRVDYKLFDGETDFTIAAPCGLYCGNCSIFRTYFDRNRQKAQKYAKEMRCRPEEIRCSGCRVEARFCWSPDCHFRSCTGEKGVEFCHECKEYPCSEIKEFSESAPHHRQIAANFERIKAVGWRQWLREQDERWRCEVCRAKLEFYDQQCPVCGRKTQ